MEGLKRTLKVLFISIWFMIETWCFIWGVFIISFIYSVYISDMKVKFIHKEDIKKGTKVEFYVKDFIRDVIDLNTNKENKEEN